MKRPFLAVVLAGIWITFSEFIRNELLFKSYWVDHYRALDLEFNTFLINGIFWLLWSFILAYIIFTFLKRFSFWRSLLTAWLAAFVMMWLALYNLQVLPLKLLLFAVPLSLLEVLVAGLLIRVFGKN